MRILILLILVSCGQPKEKCMIGQEKQMLCKAEVIGNWHPANAAEFELKQCEYQYPIGGCY